MRTGPHAAESGTSRDRRPAPLPVLARSLVFLALTSTLCLGVLGQTPPSVAPLPSPDAAYNEALRPVEITHRSVANWSDTETAALAVAVRQAAAACSQRSPKTFSGDDLVALARLCALGQQWSTVLEAASLYIGGRPPDAQTPPSPQLASAFSYQIGAALHLNDPDTALNSARAMLRTIPYGALAQESTEETAHYLQLMRTADAVALLTTRQPILLSRLRDPASLPKDLSVHELYAAGLTLAAFQQFTGAIAAAGQTVAALDATLPSPLSPDDAEPIAQSRRQYALLGRPLPAIAAAVSLFSPTETPRINTSYGSSTVLLLFPDWCAQCVRMGREFMPALYRLSEHDVHLYGLLAQDRPPPIAAPLATRSPRAKQTGTRTHAGRDNTSHDPGADGQQTPGQPATAADLLRGTPTLVVSSGVLQTFGATDFPLLAVTDHSGVVRFVQTAPENAFVPGGLVDQVTAHIAETWPANPVSPASPASAQ